MKIVPHHYHVMWAEATRQHDRLRFWTLAFLAACAFIAACILWAYLTGNL
jgi:Tfp pilus assembly protein PilN